jgi:GxxExxY protein
MMSHDPARVDAVTDTVIGCGIAVHRALGPGLLESVYRSCMALELKAENLACEVEKRVPLEYRGQDIAAGLTVDLLVEQCVIVELKAVERIHPVHLAQVITYLRLANCPAGLLLNFHTTSLRAGLRRLYHPDLYVKRHRRSAYARPAKSSNAL